VVRHIGDDEGVGAAEGEVKGLDLAADALGRLLGRGPPLAHHARSAFTQPCTRPLGLTGSVTGPTLDPLGGDLVSSPRRTPMPTYMVQASYTSTAWHKLVQRPENRMEALKPVIAKLGGEILVWYYTFGEYDVVVLFEVPSNANAAAVSMAIAGSGAVKDFKTTVLMSPDEGFDALLLAQGAGYRPPGA